MKDADTIILKGVYGQFRTLRQDHVTRQLELFGAHARNELAMILSFLRIGDTVIDIGAHIGTFSVAFARAVGASGRVIAVEAGQCPFELLEENIALNGFSDRIRPHHALITDEPGNYRSVAAPAHTSAAYYVREIGAPTLPCLGIDELASELIKGASLRLLKLDIEGMELSALRSADKLLREHRPLLYLEVCETQLERYGVAVNDVEAFLIDRGYMFFRNTGVRNSIHDEFDIVRLASLADGGAFFDCLAIPSESVEAELGQDFHQMSWLV